MSVCPKCGTTYPPRVRICTLDGTVLEEDGATSAETTDKGTLLDRKYRLDAPLGRGGMGAVYRATHVMLGKTVAVKLIKADLVGSPDMVRRFQREARAATSLNHPNIVSVYDLGQAGDGTLYIAMELVEGRSLKEEVTASGPMQPGRIAHLLTQVASALGVAHRHGIVHRDLKPQNLMISRAEDGAEIVKLLDFGIAKTHEEGATQLTQTGFALGTPQYMAPEQAAGKVVDGRTDIYALGVILYEMLTGEVPFNDPSTPAVLVKHLSEVPEPPSRRKAGLSISPLLEHAALKCLEKDPAVRFQTAEEFIAAIAPVREQQSVVDGSAATIVVPPDPAAVEGATSAPTAQTPPQAVASPASTPAVPAMPAPPPVPASASSAHVAGAAAVAGAPVAVPAPVAADTRPTAPVAPAPAVGAGSAPKRFAGRGPVVALAVAAIVIVFLGAAAGLLLYRFGFIGGGGETAESIEVPHASPAMASDSTQPGGAGDPSDAAPANAEMADTNGAANAAAPASKNDPGPVASGAAPLSPASRASVSAAAGNPPQAAARSAARSNAAAAPTQERTAEREAAAAPALPSVPVTYVECSGAPEVCGALRTAMVEALQREGVTVTRRTDTADMVLSATAQPGETQAEQQFGTSFVVQSVTIDVSAESPRLAGAEVPMPAPRTFTYDARFGRDRIGDNARLVAGEVADRVMQFWRKQALKQ